VDDDSENGSGTARGYQPEGVYALKPAANIPGRQNLATPPF
jgi:hypothetical protein